MVIPLAGGPSPFPLNPPGCQYASDPDCDDGGGGGGGGGNGNSAQCYALEQRKPPTCYSNPALDSNGNALNFISYHEFLGDNFADINPLTTELDFQGQSVIVREFKGVSYNAALVVGHRMSIAFMDTGSYTPSRSGVWGHLAGLCGAFYDIETDSRTECLQEQVEFMDSLHPNPDVGGGSWSGSVSWGAFSASIGGTRPTGNWVSNFLDKVQSDKLCKLWFEDPDQEDCN